MYTGSFYYYYYQNNTDCVVYNTCTCLMQRLLNSKFIHISSLRPIRLHRITSKYSDVHTYVHWDAKTNQTEIRKSFLILQQILDNNIPSLVCLTLIWQAHLYLFTYIFFSLTHLIHSWELFSIQLYNEQVQYMHTLAYIKSRPWE